MRIIIDSNTLFSALIKDSTTRQLILKYDDTFLFPSYIFEEMKKHENELYKKSGMNKKDFNTFLNLILKKVEIVPKATLYPYKKEAQELVKNIDPDDATFIACALAYPNSIIWSNDKKLKKLKDIKVLSTKEIIKIIKA